MSAGDKFSHSNAPVRRVKALQFGILDADFIVSARRPPPPPADRRPPAAL